MADEHGEDPRAERALTSSAEAYRLVEEARQMREERDVYRSAIEGILDLPFRHAEVHNRYLHFVLDHQRMPTDEEAMIQINCPGRAADDGEDTSDDRG